MEHRLPLLGWNSRTHSLLPRESRYSGWTQNLFRDSLTPAGRQRLLVWQRSTRLPAGLVLLLLAVGSQDIVDIASIKTDH
jgi:hypothetical protein